MATTKTSKQICVVISPIGDPDSETRKRSDKVLKHIISPSVETMGYEPIRADKISEPGIITTQIIQYIVESSLVIADLTSIQNQNIELLVQLKSNPVISLFPFLLITSSNNSKSEELNQGLNYYLRKPFLLAELLGIVQNMPLSGEGK